jgi:hypothetical protein
MEHWQFLIQKQGDRSWHTLESPHLEILEGRYRVLARSNRPNIDVEVRVIHSSSQEVPLLRRVQKRSRRTNNEGLMAVIPFTHLKPGIWELRCSGDLMSDMLGKSWQNSIKMQVLPQSAVLSDVSKLDDSCEPLLLADDSDTFSDGNLVSTGVDHSASTIDNTIPIPTAVITTQSNAATLEALPSKKEEDAIPTAVITTQSNAGTLEALPSKKQEDAVPTAVITTQSNAATLEALPSKKEEDALNDAPITPVWVKGETAEQILQNLLELALPVSESLLEDEAVDVTLAEQPPPPLLLTLEEETYVARWGETLCLNGRIELKEPMSSGETSDLESVCAAFVQIELRSPQGSQILTQVRQPLPEKILPCTISSQIEIPADCESKLILADMSLYGALAGIGEVTLLASQSFTITADVTQLLAITTAVKHSTAELDSAIAPPTTSKEPSPLDLKLFNLVKIAKTDRNLFFHASPKKALPPRIDPRSLREASLRESTNGKSAAVRSPKLPTFSHGETKMIAAAVFSENSSKSERLENTDTIVAERQVPMFKEQTRLSLNAGTTFRYLTRVKALPTNFEEVQSNPLYTLDYQTPEESQEFNTTVAESENATDLLESDEDAPQLLHEHTQLSDNSFAEVVIPQASELITPDNPYSSPLIRKWMQTQGYSLPEPFNVQSQNYYTRIPTNQTISEEPPLSLGEQTLTADVNSPLVSDMGTPSDTVEEDKNIQEAENVSEVSSSPEVSQLAPLPHPQIQPNWLAQEIVVDDTPNEAETDATQSGLFEQKEEPVQDLPISLAITTANLSPLPIPQLHVPEGELIAGKSVRVRVQLPYAREQMAVKLWIEDCQTRWLLDGPHLLKNLLPNSCGELEVMTQLNIPFGCLEIRLEAIAIDMATQQESHKVTIGRTVIPPDLPTLQLDELLGM